jgi:hypothetical protein
MKLALLSTLPGILSIGMLCACGGSVTSSGVEADGGRPESGTPEGSVGMGDSGAPDGDSGGPVFGRVPLNHRPNDAQCSTTAAAGTCGGEEPFPDGGCTMDNDCTSGKEGRCIGPGGGPASDCACTYDTCAGDTDCPSGQTCGCHGSPYIGGSGNTCVSGNCRVDADCGKSGYCSPSPIEGCGPALGGYFCHTGLDECVDDSDCSPGPTTPGGGFCSYVGTDARWECVTIDYCG